LLTGLALQGEFSGMGRPSQPWAIYTQMSQFFDLRTIEKDAAAIPDDVKVLVLVHPQGLPEKTLYAIDQFVLRGGHALVFVDPHAEGQMLRPGPAQQTGLTSSNLKTLFDAWGVEMVPGKVVGDRAAARRVNAGDQTRVRAVDYVAWLSLTAANFNRSDVLTSDLNTIQMASAGILKAKDGATTKLEPLIQTSPQSEEIDVDKVKMQPDPVALLAEFKARTSAIPWPRAFRARSRQPSPMVHRPSPRRTKTSLLTLGRRRPNARRPAGRAPDRSQAADQRDRDRRHRHAGRPVLGAGPGFLRPDRRDSLRVQR